MWCDIEYVKGIHPGKILERELKLMGMSQKALAVSCGIHPQTLNAVIQGRRGLSAPASVMLDSVMGHESGYYLVLQAYYDARVARKEMTEKAICAKPEVDRMLFWDTDFDKIDWLRCRQFVLKRVELRGSDADKEAINRFYRDYDLRMSSL